MSQPGRFLKFLSLCLRDSGLRRQMRALVYFLTRLDSLPPDVFEEGISSWGKSVSALQQYYAPAEGAPLRYDESLADRNPDLLKRMSERAAKEIEGFHNRPTFTIITTSYGAAGKGIRNTLQSIRQQFYDRLEVYLLTDRASEREVARLAGEVFGDDVRVRVKPFGDLEQNLAGAFNEVLGECMGDFVCFLSGHDRLTTNATFELCRALNAHTNADVIYSDEAKVSGQWPIHSFHKPGWSRDLFLSMNYLQNFLCCRTAAIRAAGGFRGRFEPDIKYDLLLRIIESAERIYHIPEVLYHVQVSRDYYPQGFSADAVFRLQKEAIEGYLRRRNTEGEVCDGIFRGSYRVRRKILGDPKVSIIIPTRDKMTLLKQCIESIETKSRYRNYEIIVVDNGSAEPATLEYLAGLPHTVLRYPHEFNYSKINNFGAKQAAGEHLLFLNNDTEVIAPGWIEALVEHSQREEVGGVGAKLLYPNGLVQHAGMVMWPSNISGHVHWLADLYDHGYDGLADVVRNFNSVTGACFMMRAGVFKEIGGFNESLPITYNDVDLCLQARALGYLIVYTPFALLYHYEGISRLSVVDNAGEMAEIQTTLNGKPVTYQVPVPKGHAEEVRSFYARWKSFIQNDGNYISKRGLGSNSS